MANDSQSTRKAAGDGGIGMCRSPLSDGTLRVSDLTLPRDGRRAYEKDGRGTVWWRPHPECVRIPDDVSVIGRMRCPTLGEITLPPSVTEIGELAFGAEFLSGDTYEWYALHTVHFSQGLRQIGRRAFYNCRHLDAVHLPKGLLEIGEDAFCLCLSLSRITIPAGVTRIGARAFGKCEALEEVIVMDGPSSLGGSVFSGDIRLRRVGLPPTLRRIGTACFAGCVALSALSLPEGLCELGAGAFEDCTALTSLSIHRDLENAEEMRTHSPFEGCTSLSELSLGASVTRGDWIPPAPALTAIRVAKDNPHLTEKDGLLYSRDGRTLLRVPSGKRGTLVLPRGVTAIAPYALFGCHAITGIALPSTLRKVGKGAFAGCTALRELTLPGRLLTIGDGALAGCTALSSLHIPPSVSSLGDKLFSGCPTPPPVTVSPANPFFTVRDGRLVPRT
ncbi:MAG: leucine-rich repeat domain-containing protein [Clostridia bacterium]|nr:leucine-rich repeat domain-containing protein [Clostridia bacterium]